MIPGYRPHARASSLTAILACLLLVEAAPADAEPFGWQQSPLPGTPVVLRYSFVNLFDPPFASIPEAPLRTATEEALKLWSQYAPLHFIESVDSGPPPSDADYPADGHPEIRIGAHADGDELVLAHAFIPDAANITGLSGDIHFNSESILNWGIEDGFPVVDFLEVLVHEIGHVLGLVHIDGIDAIMNPLHGFRFRRGESAFLLPADIEAIRALYGAGEGSVEPMPEPTTIALVSTGLLAALVRRARRRRC